MKVEATDLAEVLDTDISDVMFIIDGVANAEGIYGEPAKEETSIPSDQMGTSPVTGEMEDITAVNAGDYISSPSFSTVYYVDSNMVRHPFMDAQTFYTWQDSFDVIKTVTDATLSTLDLGVSMLPKPGVVLVKIQSIAKVYAVEENPDDMLMPNLRWITSEATATDIYGADWADYVIDISSTLFGYYGSGDDVNSASDISVDLTMMKKREEL
ncbi:hypothetical protein IH979_00950 [Patescibacteria group bacterium]|nr:hypothetical protein [Patescibacteria group bacterium]